MHTVVHVVARAGRSPWSCAVGGLAVRRTGVDALHLISTAATPLGGDRIDIRVEVEPGARLWLGTVAATIALPARIDPHSSAGWTVDVADTGRLCLAPQPTVVAATAAHETTTRVRLARTATVEIDESAQIGRHGETGGAWSGRLWVDVDDTPTLRHRLELGAGSVLGDHHSAVVSRFAYPDAGGGDVSTSRTATRMAVAGGASLVTALGRTVADARSAEATIGR
ncbi:urease accessory protein UreD [uncultured Williamsia sp.]|uniref:urease accessory protein UreD n=1 Tax=uncultured Williamsia sp. TaxID=259311 RepID=UPI002605B696|nr:urease accessory protein UreD [uncultured Williamsia sp.]